jgi:hypothetical protein
MTSIDRVARAASCFVGVLLVMLTIRVAHAAESGDDDKIAPIDKRENAVWDHLEVSMGFLAGQRRYSSTPFAIAGGGNGSVAGATSLVAPFQRQPFDNAAVFGVRYDVRVVVSYVRMTAGFDLPFTAFNLGDGTGRYSVGGVDRDVSVRSIGGKDLRFGLGGEYPFGPVAPFVDLVGAIHWVNTTLAIDGVGNDYVSSIFAFSVRAGARLHVRKWFFASLAAELGIVGDVRWGADLSVGFAFM